MNITEALKSAGFKPEANTDGEWKPYVGTYRCTWKTLRPEVQKDGAEFVQAEWDIEEALAGDPKRGESKYADFKRRYYFAWENPDERGLDNAKDLANDIFTATGKDVDLSSKEAFANSAASLIDFAKAEAYIRSWGWTPEKDTKGNVLAEDQRKTIQQFVIQRKAVAEKKRTGASLPF